MSISPFGLGFIGCGSYNATLAAAAARSEKLKPVACFDIVKECTEAFASANSIQACATLDELLNRDDIQGVVIATSNNTHKPITDAAAAAGKHVYVEKPIANTLEDAFAMIEATEKAGVVLAVGHNGRRLGGHRKMKEMIEAGEIGKPVTVEANFSHSGGLGLTPSQWRYFKEECPGLPLMQLGVHFADTVQYLLGNVLDVSSFMTHAATPADNNDVTVSLLKFGNGLLGYLGSNYASPPVYYVNIYGTGGNLYCNGGHSLRYLKAGAEGPVMVEVPAIDTQREELEEFAECALTGKKYEVDGYAGVRALAVVRAALKSNEENRPVSIDSIIAEAKDQ